jgi:DNA uptake protein ComE-like DNA-binding protein
MKLFRKQIIVVAAYLLLLLSFAGVSYSQDKVDLNSASESQLVDLPGVGKATAKKIIAGRPYSSVSDLSKAGVSNATITKITPLVTVGSGSAASSSKSAAPDSSTAMTPKKSKADSPSASSASSGPVDLNTASEADLIALNGVGKATAAKIIAGRPYSSVSDLSKAGVSKATITKIQGQVTVSGAAAASSKPAPAPSAPASTPAPSKSAPAASSTTSSAPAAAPAASSNSGSSAKSSAASKAAPRTEQAAGGGNGLVWVNTKSGVYHKEGDRWYGRTEEGKYMSEPDAIKAGYRAEKTREKKAQ